MSEPAGVPETSKSERCRAPASRRVLDLDHGIVTSIDRFDVNGTFVTMQRDRFQRSFDDVVTCGRSRITFSLASAFGTPKYALVRFDFG